MYFLNFYKIILILYFFLPLLPPSHLCPCCVTCLGFIVLVATWYPSNHPRSFKSDWLPSAYKFISCIFADSIRLLIWPPYDKPSPRLWNEVSKQLAKTSKRHYMHIYICTYGILLHHTNILMFFRPFILFVWNYYVNYSCLLCTNARRKDAFVVLVVVVIPHLILIIILLLQCAEFVFFSYFFIQLDNWAM